MPIVAEVQNPLKKYAFKVTVGGIVAALVQKVVIPEVEIEKVAHGNYNHDTKTAGRLKYGDVTLEKLVPGDSSDLQAFTWLMLAQTPVGVGGVAAVYKRPVLIEEFGPLGNRVRGWLLNGAWVHKYEPGERDAMSSDNVIEKVTLSIDNYLQA